MLDLRLGSSRDCRSPAPRVGSWVWNTDTRPPVGDMSLYATCRAGPRALWVSRVCMNIPGSALSRSFTSCEHKHTFCQIPQLQKRCHISKLVWHRDMKPGNGNTNTKIQGLKIQRERMIRFKPLYSLWDSPADCCVLGWKYLRKSQKETLDHSSDAMLCRTVMNSKEPISLWNKCFSQIPVGHNYQHP